jgi:hypothetical protein
MQVQTWRGSQHQQAFVSADFQASLHEEAERTFCISCHAPLTKTLGLTAQATHEGVSCVSCHAQSEAHANALAQGNHAERATTGSCEACHTFATPKGHSLLQATMLEHRASASREISCIRCHMPNQGSAHSHAFSVSRNPELLTASVRLVPLARDAETVRFALETLGVGHRFPTGDVFRNLNVRAHVEDSQGRILASLEEDLHRDWEQHRKPNVSLPAQPNFEHERDTRLGDSPRTFDLKVPQNNVHGLRLFVSVHYQRGFEARGALQLFPSSNANVEILNYHQAVAD